MSSPVARTVSRNALADLAVSIPVGVVLVDSAGMTLVQNATARVILESGTPLAVRNGILTAPGCGSKLRSLIRSALADPGEVRATLIPRPNGQQALAILATAVRWADQSIDDEPAVAVLISDPRMRWFAPHSVLRDLYGFTRTESALASKLLNGDSLTLIAQQSATSLNTVRSHLKRLFHKTGTCRQAELVRILLSALLLSVPAEMGMSNQASR